MNSSYTILLTVISMIFFNNKISVYSLLDIFMSDDTDYSEKLRTNAWIFSLDTPYDMVCRFFM